MFFKTITKWIFITILFHIPQASLASGLEAFKKQVYSIDYNLVKIIDGNTKSYSTYRDRIDFFLKKTKPNPKQTPLFQNAFLSTVKNIARNKKSLANDLLFFHRVHKKSPTDKKALYLNNIVSKVDMMRNANQLKVGIAEKLKLSLFKKIQKNLFVHNSRHFLDVKGFPSLIKKKRVLEYDFKTQRIVLVDNIYYKKKHQITLGSGQEGAVKNGNPRKQFNNLKRGASFNELERIKKILMRNYDYLLVRMIIYYQRCNSIKERYNRELAKLNPNIRDSNIDGFFARRQYLLQDICSIDFFHEDSVTLLMDSIYDARERNEISYQHYIQMMNVLTR